MSQSRPEWPYPRYIAHRGGGNKAPENTLVAFRKGANCGYRMMEYDVKLTADDVPILLHDDTLERTSSGTGEVGELRYAELARYDFGSWFSTEYAGEAVATLYSIAAYTQANAICSNIEIKPTPGMENHSGERIALVARRLWAKAQLPPLLSSFSENALAAARDTAPELPRALLIDKELPADWLQRAKWLECCSINLNDEYVLKEVVEDIHAAGLAVVVWTVNDPARAQELLTWGCDAIITDEIEAIGPGQAAT